MDVKEVCSKIDNHIIYLLAVTKEEVTPSAHLKDELGMDSLDDIELVMMLEEEFEIKISDEEAVKCRTVKDVYDGVLGKLGLSVTTDYLYEVKTPNNETKSALVEVKNCTFTSSDIFQQMLKVAQDNNLFIQFDGIDPETNSGIVVTHSQDDTEYDIKTEEDFNKLLQCFSTLEQFKKKVW